MATDSVYITKHSLLFTYIFCPQTACIEMTTRSGLVASPRKFVKRVKKTVDVNSLLPCAITRPAPFSLKPYAGLFNPYNSKGCSVLCNHPARVKPSWVKEEQV